MLSFPSCVDNQLSSIQKAIKSLLRRYEERFLGTNVPSLVCPHQDMRMSSFIFETGKMSDEEYQFFHNGPDFTEVILYVLYSRLESWTLPLFTPFSWLSLSWTSPSDRHTQWFWYLLHPASLTRKMQNNSWHVSERMQRSINLSIWTCLFVEISCSCNVVVIMAVV